MNSMKENFVKGSNFNVDSNSQEQFTFEKLLRTHAPSSNGITSEAFLNFRSNKIME